MSEIADRFITTSALGIPAPDEFAVSYSHSQTLGPADRYIDFPAGANIGFTATVDTDTSIKILYLHLSQSSAGQVYVECRVAGNPVESTWQVGISGKMLRVYSQATNISGLVLSADLVLEAVIDSVFWDGKKFKLYATGTLDNRPARTLPISNILYLQTSSTGRRSTRFPVTWGVQAGDSITNDVIGSFVIGKYALTIQPGYGVIDAVEAL